MTRPDRRRRGRRRSRRAGRRCRASARSESARSSPPRRRPGSTPRKPAAGTQIGTVGRRGLIGRESRKQPRAVSRARRSAAAVGPSRTPARAAITGATAPLRAGRPPHRPRRTDGRHRRLRGLAHRGGVPRASRNAAGARRPDRRASAITCMAQPCRSAASSAAASGVAGVALTPDERDRSADQSSSAAGIGVSAELAISSPRAACGLGAGTGDVVGRTAPSRAATRSRRRPKSWAQYRQSRSWVPFASDRTGSRAGPGEVRRRLSGTSPNVSTRTSRRSRSLRPAAYRAAMPPPTLPEQDRPVPGRRARSVRRASQNPTAGERPGAFPDAPLPRLSGTHPRTPDEVGQHVHPWVAFPARPVQQDQWRPEPPPDTAVGMPASPSCAR